MGIIESIIDYRKLQFYGQLCRLPFQYLARNMFHQWLLRYINNDRRCLGFIPDIYRLIRKYNLLPSVYTRLLFQRRDLSIGVTLKNDIDQ